MPFILRFVSALPSLSSPKALIAWALDWAQQLLAALQALVMLDGDVRQLRSLNAERAQLFTSAIVTAAGVTAIATLVPAVLSETFTTALINFDASSGAGRWLCTGGVPVSAATAAAGMPIPAGGYSLTITGQRNIADFRAIGEPAQALNMSIILYK